LAEDGGEKLVEEKLGEKKSIGKNLVNEDVLEDVE